MVRKTKKDAAQTRRQILEQATQLFEKQGYKATHIDEIANKLGLTKGAVFYHFKSKRDLFTTIWVELQKKMDTDIRRTAAKAAAESVDPFAGMMAGAQVQVNYLKQKRFSQIVMIEGPTVLGMAEWIRRDVELSTNRINKAIDFLVAKGQLKANDKESLNLLFVGMLSYAVMASKDVEDPTSILKSFEIILRGLPNSVESYTTSKTGKA